MLGRAWWRRAWRIAVASLVVVLGGCGSSEPPLRLGTNLWPGYEPFYLARDLGYLQSRQVHLIELLSASEVIRAYRNGALDAAALTLDEALLLIDDGVPAQIALVTDTSHGTDRILAREALQMRELQGKRIGVETTALGAYMLTRALMLNDLSSEQVQVVPLELDRHEQAYLRGEVDAVVTFDPVASRLMQQGARSIFDSSMIPDEIVDVLVVRPELATQRPEQLRHLLDGWFRALDYLQREPQQATELMAVRLDMSAEQFERSVAGIRIPDRAHNRELLLTPALRAQAERLSRLMLEQRLISHPLALDDLVVSREVLE